MYMGSSLALATSLELSERLNPFLVEGEYLEKQRRKSVREGELGLMLAILEDATRCYVKYMEAKDKKGRQQFREAEEWIFEEHSDWLFSFENVCEILRIDPGYLRRGLLQWKKRTKQEVPENLAGRVGTKAA